jgi:predicted phosphohydrolase
VPRLLITADLHYNQPKSRALADELIERMNHVGGDAVLLVGDTAGFDGDALEGCLSRFQTRGPKLFIAGNHELWTSSSDSYDLYRRLLPERIRRLGWHWLEDEPFSFGDVAIVGSVGWYDYSFAQPGLGIPRRFYQHKISPGAAERFSEYRHLLDEAGDISPTAREVTARWNDAKFVKLHRSDEAFLDELLARLESQLDSLSGKREIIAAVHHLPFRELLPPPHSAQWDFAKAFLGSEKIGRLLLRYENVRHVFCGHSHFAAETHIQHIHATNIGSGYRAKTFKSIDLDTATF